jgi:hypothetical protein
MAGFILKGVSQNAQIHLQFLAGGAGAHMLIQGLLLAGCDFSGIL